MVQVYKKMTVSGGHMGPRRTDSKHIRISKILYYCRGEACLARFRTDSPPMLSIVEVLTCPWFCAKQECLRIFFLNGHRQ